MITRPLELASHLRPAPRNFDALFYVNAGLLALFFVFFGSAFVLGPAIGVDFQLPEVAGATQNQAPFTDNLTVVSAGQIFAGGSKRSPSELRDWLRTQARAVKKPSLLIFADKNVPLSIVTEIAGEAAAAGFAPVQIAGIEPKGASPAGK